MKKSQFAEEQIIKILREAEAGADTIQTVCRKHGISEQTFYRWRHGRETIHFGVVQPDGCWKTKFLRRSPNYTTCLKDVLCIN